MTYRSRSVVLVLSLFVATAFCTGCSVLNKNQNDGPGMETSEDLNRINQQMQEITLRLSALEKLEQRLENQNDAMEAMKTRLSSLEKQATDNNPAPQTQAADSAKTDEIPDTTTYTEPTVLYQEARKLLQEKRFKDAALLFEKFKETYPESELADNALYWMGECYYSQGEFLKAAEIFKSTVKLYPKGSKVPDSLLKTAYAYLAVDDMDRAHHYLKTLVKTYPFTPAGEKAEAKLRSFQ